MQIKAKDLIVPFTTCPFYVISVYHFKINPGEKGHLRGAPFPGFILPLKGKARYSFEGKEYIAQSGKAIHCGKRTQIKKEVLGNQPWEYILVLYYIDEKKIANRHFEIEIKKNIKLPDLFLQLWEVFNQSGEINTFRSELIFRCILNELFASLEDGEIDETKGLFDELSTYIQRHYAEALSVQELAKEKGVSENQLFYIFNKYAGMGPRDYIINQRLNRGKELLLTTDAKVGDIAESIGYQDPLYFSRLFKKRLGFSPTEARERFRESPL